MLKDRKEAEDRPLLHALKIKFAEIPNILAACLWEGDSFYSFYFPEQW